MLCNRLALKFVCKPSRLNFYSFSAKFSAKIAEKSVNSDTKVETVENFIIGNEAEQGKLLLLGAEAEYCEPKPNKTNTRKLSLFAWRKMRQSLIDPGKFYVFTWNDTPKSTEHEKPSIKMTFLFKNHAQIDKEIVLYRKPDSLLSETFQRLSTKLQDLHGKRPKKAKKLKKDSNPADDNTQISLNASNNDISLFPVHEFCVKNDIDQKLDAERTTNFEAFLEHGKTFSIADRSYSIQKQAPYFEKFKFITRLFVGFPVLPSVDIVGAENSFSQSRYHWYVESAEFNEQNFDQNLISNIFDITRCNQEDIVGNKDIVDGGPFQIQGFEYRSTAPFYIPSQKDLNRRICVIGIPKNRQAAGIPNMFISASVIENISDEEMVWHERHALCAEQSEPDRLRVVSYNILADLYLDLEKTPQADLFFAHCPVEYQRVNYRYPLLLSEISGYRADLLCLQEVDMRFYKRFLSPYFNYHGYNILYAKKGKEVNEGSVTIFKPEKLTHMHSYDTVVSNLVEDTVDYGDLVEIAKYNDETFELFKSRPAVLQVNFFRSTISGHQDNVVCVCNTHLHFHPQQGHIRLLQIAFCQRYIQKVVEKVKKEYPTISDVGILLCGDLNSTPDSTVCRSLRTGRIGADNAEWYPPADTAADKPESQPPRKGVDFQVPFALRSACPCEYTNFVGKDNFSGCLDYIFVSPQLFDVSVVYPMPRHALVEKYYGLPSKLAPSDHLPLICELTFKK